MHPDVMGQIAEGHIADLYRDAEAYRRAAPVRRARGWSWSRLWSTAARRHAPVPVPPMPARPPALRVIPGGSTPAGR